MKPDYSWFHTNPKRKRAPQKDLPSLALFEVAQASLSFAYIPGKTGMRRKNVPKNVRAKKRCNSLFASILHRNLAEKRNFKTCASG